MYAWNVRECARIGMSSHVSTLGSVPRDETVINNAILQIISWDDINGVLAVNFTAALRQSTVDTTRAVDYPSKR